MSDTGFRVGQLVRINANAHHVDEGDVGKLVTIRAFGKTARRAVRVDDGDPDDPDINTNGFFLSSWLPIDAIVAVST